VQEAPCTTIACAAATATAAAAATVGATAVANPRHGYFGGKQQRGVREGPGAGHELRRRREPPPASAVAVTHFTVAIQAVAVLVKGFLRTTRPRSVGVALLQNQVIVAAFTALRAGAVLFLHLTGL